MESALDRIDIRNANASVATDIARITAAVEADCGVVEFNRLVHDGLVANYQTLASSATFSM